MDDVSFIMKFEEGRATQAEKKKWFQKKVNDGSIWKLQGFYGREAQRMINDGEIDYPKKETYDAYGNKIPTQADIKKQFGKYQTARERRKMRSMT